MPDLSPEAPYALDQLEKSDSISEGYLQISLDSDGHITLRGTRMLADWLLKRMASEGWQLEVDPMTWCG